jgi:hypothetical protein
MAAQRYGTKELASVEVYGRNSGPFVAQVKDLSETGACLVWKESITGSIIPGDLLKVTIILKTLGRKHKISGEVIWSNGLKSGLRFLNSDQLIDRMIEKEI